MQKRNSFGKKYSMKPQKEKMDRYNKKQKFFYTSKTIKSKINIDNKKQNR